MFDEEMKAILIKEFQKDLEVLLLDPNIPESEKIERINKAKLILEAYLKPLEVSQENSRASK